MVQSTLSLDALFKTFDGVEWDPFVIDGQPVYALCGSTGVVKQFKKLRGDVSFKFMEEFIIRFVCQKQTGLGRMS